MSAFVVSQVLVAIAICFDFVSFQFKDRRKIIVCLFCAGALISSHFMLLEQWAAASLTAIATGRYLISFFSTSSRLKYLFCSTSIVITFFTYTGLISVLSCLGSVFNTMAAFNKDDRRLREFMIIGTVFWLLHNYLIGSPAAVLMETLFICSNLIGYYRYYYKNSVVIQV